MASSSPFDLTRSYWAKFERGKKHLADLQRAIPALGQLQPYSIFEDLETEPGACIFRLRYNDPIPTDIGLMIGDCLHNFRAALDHVIFALSRPRIENPKESGFPICVARDQFDGPAGKRRGPSGVSKIKHCPPSARPVILRHQPYRRMDGTETGHPLWLLNELENIDKHRLFHIVAANLKDATAKITTMSGETILRIALKGGIREDGTELGRVDRAGMPGGYVHLESEVFFTVAFRPVAGVMMGDQDVNEILVSIGQEIRSILEELDPFVEE